jgi:hypothetical protein
MAISANDVVAGFVGIKDGVVSGRIDGSIAGVNRDELRRVLWAERSSAADISGRVVAAWNPIFPTT